MVRFLVSEKSLILSCFSYHLYFLQPLVSIDIIYQLIFTKDIFGIEPMTPRKLSGPFADELIAGAIFKDFFYFFIFALPLFLKLKQPYLRFFGNYIVIFLVSIILSGNRMPLLLFLFFNFLIYPF